MRITFLITITKLVPSTAKNDFARQSKKNYRRITVVPSSAW